MVNAFNRCGIGLTAPTGFDTVGLGYTNNTGPTLKHQIVSEIVSDSWWFGMLGLGFQPTNFTGYGDPQASFADTLYSNGSISSMSWSYTAGAYYRLKGIFGSLIFGGYDASRFTPNNVTFTMTGDNLRDIVVTIRAIKVTASTGQTTLMSTPEFAFIDSSVPELWLPVSVCQAFEKALNLTLDNSTGLYLIDSSVHDALLTLNPNITITLANQKQGGAMTDIILPYAAFDLNVTSPILTNRTSYYFPIRRGSDDTQYTLGRTFLQEAYVITHYESRTFNVSQCIFDDTAKPHIIALPPVLASSSSSSSSSSGSASNKKSKLSKGAIIGIVVGLCGITLLALLFLALFLIRRHRQNQKEHNRESAISELAGNPHASQSQGKIDEVDGSDAKFEKFGNPIMVPQELEAEPVPGPARGAKTPMAEMGQDEGGLSAVSEEHGKVDTGGHVVSPEGTYSSTFSSKNSKTKQAVVVGGSTSGTVSTGSSPTSLKRRGSRFEEHLGDM